MNRNAKTVTWHPITMKVGKPIDLSQFPKEDPAVAIDAVRTAVAEGIIDK